MAKQTNILIHGSGAIGAFYASRLSLVPSTSVSCICRSNYTHVSSTGFQIASPKYGSYTFIPQHTFSSPSHAKEITQSQDIHWDFIVVATKALATDDSSVLEGLVGRETVIVVVQNGIGVEEGFYKRFPGNMVLSAVTIASVAQTEHGQIKHNRWTRISIGPYLPSSSSPAENEKEKEKEKEKEGDEKNKEFVELLRKGGIKDAEAYTHQKLQMIRWHKLALNAAMNPVSVLTGCLPNSVMASNPSLSLFLAGIMSEILHLGSVVLNLLTPAENPASKEFSNWGFNQEDGFASIEKILESTRRNDSGSKPSMALDWEQGKELESEVILGRAVKMGRERGVDMARVEGVWALLGALEEGRRRGSKL